MNIEDSIEILKNSKNLYLKEKIDSDILEEAIETLLTAYEKEKEKIEKEIKKIKDSNTYGYVGEEWNDRDVVELLENLISKEE